jgi:hypothetical protein
VNDLKDAVWQACCDGSLGEVVSAAWCPLTWLENDGISGRECTCDLADHRRDRRVPGADDDRWSPGCPTAENWPAAPSFNGDLLPNAAQMIRCSAESIRCTFGHCRSDAMKYATIESIGHCNLGEMCGEVFGKYV